MAKRLLVFILLVLLIVVTPTVAPVQGESRDERARITERKMTDDERFSLLMLGYVQGGTFPPDPRIPKGIKMGAGYTPGIPRLGIPALQSSDASMGVTNPGYRSDDKGATAFPASIVVGSSFNPRLAREKPRYHFGHGLSYTTFDYTDFKVSGGETITATFTVTNTGKVVGADVQQVYLMDAAGESRMRLLGFERVELAPGASKTVTVKADPRLLARFDGGAGLGQWRIAAGTYRIALGKSAGDLVSTADTQLTAPVFGR